MRAVFRKSTINVSWNWCIWFILYIPSLLKSFSSSVWWADRNLRCFYFIIFPFHELLTIKESNDLTHVKLSDSMICQGVELENPIISFWIWSFGQFFLIRSTDLLKRFDSEEWLNSVAFHSKPLNDFSSLKYSTQVKLTIFIYLFVYLSYAKNSLKLNEIPSVLTETWVNMDQKCRLV